jgi:hypothetical protein
MDVWILFPLGVAVNRLLTRDPCAMLAGWRSRLDLIFGTSEWFGRFYKEEVRADLFGSERRTRKACTLQDISDYYLDRLHSIFPKVADNPRLLYNSSKNPIFEVCFAAANPGPGGDIAMKIARHILKG